MKKVQYLESKKYSSLIFAACFAVYTASYIGRINFSAALADIVAGGLFTKSEAGIIGSAFFFVYGAFQIINGFLSDKLSPFKMITAGTFLSGVANICMSFCQTNTAMAVVWGFNGFALSLLWSSILKILANIINDGMRSKACLNISVTLPIGTIAAYLTASVAIKFFNWKYVFYVPAVILFAVCAFFTFSYLKIKPHLTERTVQTAPVDNGAKSKKTVSLFSVLALAGVFILLPADAAHGAVKEGITTWVPTMITEIYSTDAAFSVFLSVILPIFNLTGVYIITPVYNKIFKKDELKTGAAILAFAAVPLALLIFTDNIPMVVSVALLAVITTAMHAYNYMIITLVPMRFAYCGRTATVTGIMNSTAYVGCAAASYGFGVISDKIGWNGTVAVWLAIDVAAVLITVISSLKWRKFIKIRSEA